MMILKTLTCLGSIHYGKPIIVKTLCLSFQLEGTEITYGESMEQDIAWQQLISENWNRDIVCEETAKFPDLVLQSETEQRPHKVSFYVEKYKATRIMEILLKRLEERGLDVKIIYSNGIALDVLPKAAGKGNALEYLLRTYEASGKSPKNVLVCGDSGNDTDLFTLPKIYGVMVSNALEELLQWHAKNAKNNPNIFHSSERCAAAIIQAIDKFGLGPHISARDMDDFSLREVDNVSHEVVNFYLFYERWRRAEVHRSEQSLARFKSVFSPLGIFVNHFGTEQSLQQYLVEVQGYYGDKKRTQFRVWLDRISSAQIGVDTWVVKFYQWEQTGKIYPCFLIVM
ncbi:sucrose-phosphatase 2-like isoform X2 [Impatiens glandulifera]|uniref:sucrose-phosphatase 2-like isoform X2 n=1 Tax=Impatiens glandulifera TaxID=253017 RepID=UPI001FB05D6B|nr:sucrose-phosphatase 2-like isoform X2 [Impatiens glandulifera]